MTTRHLLAGCSAAVRQLGRPGPSRYGPIVDARTAFTPLQLRSPPSPVVHYRSFATSPSGHTVNDAPAPSAPPPNRRQRRSRTFRFARAFVVLGLATYAGLELDQRFNAAAVTRSLRTGWMGLVTTLDYKWNFSPSNSGQIDALHERVAARLHDTIVSNQGLYIKMGQAIGLQAALLPKPYRTAFANIFDNAPNVPYDEIVQIFKHDFGVDSPLKLFKTFDEVPIASASIAQVHVATIDRHDDKGRKWEEKVAVKVQKPAIEKQMEWDLWSYRTLLYLSEKLFKIPSKPAHTSRPLTH